MGSWIREFMLETQIGGQQAVVSRDFENVRSYSSRQFSCSVCFELQSLLGLPGNVANKLFPPAPKEQQKQTNEQIKISNETE